MAALANPTDSHFNTDNIISFLKLYIGIAMKYRYKEKDKLVKFLSLFLLLTIIASAILVYSYNQQLVQSNLQIQSLELTVANLQSDIQSKLDTISNNTKTIAKLNTQLQIDDLLIETLGNKLGIAQSEIKSLTPVTRRYYAVAVRSNSGGLVIPFDVKITNGTGLVSVNIRNVDLLSGTQDSIRIAVAVSEMQTNTDLSNKDVTVSFVNEQEEIVSLDGPSAGAVITTAIIAAIQNNTIDTTVLATGAINPDGSIGLVGGVNEKAAAAASFGAKIFLVPYGEKISYGSLEIREVKNIQEITNLILK